MRALLLHRLRGPLLAIPGTDMRVEEIEVGARSEAEGLDLRAVMHSAPNVHILGVRRWHEADGPLHAGDMLVVLGTAVGLARLTAMLRHVVEVADPRLRADTPSTHSG